MVNVYKSASGDGDGYVSLTAIGKELAEINEKSEAVSQKVKSLGEDLAKAKETLLILTGAKLAYKKIIDAASEKEGPKEDQSVEATATTNVAS